MLPQSLAEAGLACCWRQWKRGRGDLLCVAVSGAGEARRHFQLMVMGESPAPSASFLGWGWQGVRVGGKQWRR